MNCENCDVAHDGEYGSGRFCSSRCARGFSTKSNRAEINERVSLALSGRKSPTSKFYKPHVLSTEERNLGTKTSQAYYLSKYENSSFDDLGRSLKKRKVLSEQDGKCARCSLSEWQGEPIRFELEHKDGDTLNNSRENLECLCPNCHSLTPTWRKKKSAR